MKILYNWIKEFVPLNVKPNKLSHDLSLFGHEVEKIEKYKKDFVLDFEITPNRGDLLSHIGMSREIASLYNLKMKILSIKINENKLSKKININILNYDVCQRFTARVIDNIQVKESPQWIKDRLIAYGFRPINNIVDITNYVMIETGQPLHAFDYNKISNGIIKIRNAKHNESIVTLDGKNRILNEDSIVIEDRKKIYDLAGIMGGYNSEIDTKTKTIVLQGAIFNPKHIRRTSKKLKLITDASYRYERGVDFNGTQFGVDRATFIIQSICKKSIISKIYDVKSNYKESKIKVDFNKINNLIGTNLKETEIKKILTSLNFKVNSNIITVPSYRINDVKIWQDIAEEVARKFGYNNIRKLYLKKEKPLQNNDFSQKENLRDLLFQHGFSEVYSYTFCDEKLIKLLKFNLNNCRYVINSISPENKYLRPSLTISLLSAVAKNPWAPEINIFEIGKIFYNNKEKWQLGIVTTNKKAENIKEILLKLNIKNEIMPVPQNTLDYLKIRKQIKYAVVDLIEIKKLSNHYLDHFPNIEYNLISDYPPTIRDLAFIVDKKIDSNLLINDIKSLNKKIFLVELFDEFISDKFGKNKKNLAFHIWMQNISSPMKDKEIKTIINKIICFIEQKYQAKLRG